MVRDLPTDYREKLTCRGPAGSVLGATGNLLPAGRGDAAISMLGTLDRASEYQVCQLGTH